MATLYRYDEIRHLHLEITSRCQAACPMCGRNLNGGRARANLPLEEITLDEFRAWFPEPFLRRLTHFYMCGNFGDPIVARDCLPIYAHVRSVRPRLSLGMNTNGGARSRGFWRELAGLDVAVRFGIDGATAASHERYRRNTRFETVLANAQVFIAAGGNAIWEMLTFRHNDHEIEAAEAMAEALGFRKFVLKTSNRFGAGRWDVHDEAGNVVDRLQQSLRHPPPATAAPDPASLASCAIECQVAGLRSLYVAAGGLVFPCCWLGQLVHHRPGAPDSHMARGWMAARIAGLLDTVDEIGIANLDLHHTALEEIVDRHLPRFARRWAPRAGPAGTMRADLRPARAGQDRIGIRAPGSPGLNRRAPQVDQRLGGVRP